MADEEGLYAVGSEELIDDDEGARDVEDGRTGTETCGSSSQQQRRDAAGPSGSRRSTEGCTAQEEMQQQQQQQQQEEEELDQELEDAASLLVGAARACTRQPLPMPLHGSSGGRIRGQHVGGSSHVEQTCASQAEGAGLIVRCQDVAKSSPFKVAMSSDRAQGATQGTAGSCNEVAHAAMQPGHVAMQPLMQVGLVDSMQQAAPSSMRANPSEMHVADSPLGGQSAGHRYLDSALGRERLKTVHPSSPPYCPPVQPFASSSTSSSSSPADQQLSKGSSHSRQQQQQWTVSRGTPVRDGSYLYCHTRFLEPPLARRQLLPELISAGNQPHSPAHPGSRSLSAAAPVHNQSPASPARGDGSHASSLIFPHLLQGSGSSHSREGSPVRFTQEQQPAGAPTPCSLSSSPASRGGSRCHQQQPAAVMAAQLSPSPSHPAHASLHAQGSPSSAIGSPLALSPQLQPALPIDSPHFSAYRQVLAMRQAQGTALSSPTSSTAAGAAPAAVQGAVQSPVRGAVQATGTRSPVQLNGSSQGLAVTITPDMKGFGSPAAPSTVSPHSPALLQHQLQQQQQQTYSHSHINMKGTMGLPTPDQNDHRAAHLQGDAAPSGSSHHSWGSDSPANSCTGPTPTRHATAHASSAQRNGLLNGCCGPVWPASQFQHHAASSSHQASPIAHDNHNVTSMNRTSPGAGPPVHHQYSHNSHVGEAASVLAQARQQKSDLVELADRTIQMWKSKWVHAQHTAQELQQQLEELCGRCEAAMQQAQQTREGQAAAEEAATKAKAAQAAAQDALEAREQRAAAAEAAVSAAEERASAAESRAAEREEQARVDCERMRAEVSAAQDAAERAAAEAAEMRSQVTRIQQELDQALATATATQQAVEQARAAGADQAAVITQARAEAAEARRSLEVAEGRAREAEGETARARSNLESLRRELEGIRTQLSNARGAQAAQAAAEANAQAARVETARLAAALEGAAQDLATRRAQAEEAGRDAARATLLANALRAQLGEAQAAVMELQQGLTAAEHAAALSVSAADELRGALAAAQADHATSLQELQHLRQRLEDAERQVDAQAAALESVMEEVSQMRLRLQCMSGQDEALSAQPLGALEALEALLEAALPRIRAAATRRRVEAARSEAAAAAAAAAVSQQQGSGLSTGGGGGGAVTPEPGSEHRAGRDGRRAQLGSGQQQGHARSTRNSYRGEDVDGREGMSGGSGSGSQPHAAQLPVVGEGSNSSGGGGRVGEEDQDEREQCAVCLTASRNTVLGCGHLFCRECATRLVRCAICRATITSRGPAFV